MEFKNLIETNKFTLVVSLPSNNLEMAKAALEGDPAARSVEEVILSYPGLIVIDDGDDPASISLTYRGHMIVDLLRWMEMILRPIVF